MTRRARAWIGIAILVAVEAGAGACVVPDLDETGKSCTGDRCPSGLPCVHGICGGAVGEGGPADGGPDIEDAAGRCALRPLGTNGIAYVQGTYRNGYPKSDASVEIDTVTLDSPVTKGNLLVACGSWGTYNPDIDSVEDNVGNDWALLDAIKNANPINVVASCWYAAKVDGGSTTVTFGFTDRTVGSNLVVVEYAGVQAVDIRGAAIGNSADAAPSAGTFNASFASELVIGWEAQQEFAIVSPGAGFTIEPALTKGHAWFALEHAVLPCQRAVAADFSLTGRSVSWVAIVASFH